MGTAEWGAAACGSRRRDPLLRAASHLARACFFVGLLAVAYAPVRFGFDFLRTVDVRYAGLTPAQWACFAVIGAGGYLMARSPSTT